MARGRSGGELGEENVVRFMLWKEERVTNDDWHVYVRGNQLNRTEIAKEIGCGRSAMRQNRRIKRRLAWYERVLRHRGVLGERADPTPEEPLQVAAGASVRLTREIHDLKRQVQQLQAKCADLEARNGELGKQLDAHNIALSYEDLQEDLFAMERGFPQ